MTLPADESLDSSSESEGESSGRSDVEDSTVTTAESATPTTPPPPPQQPEKGGERKEERIKVIPDKPADSFQQRYRVVDKIGEGSYSEVLKCKSKETGMVVACKRLKHSYKSWSQINDIAEIVALRTLPRHTHILQMLEIHFDVRQGKVSLVFEIMDMNLYELIKDRKKLLSETTVRILMYQLMKALRHLHKYGVFHRDIKPENILVRKKSNVLKLGDLGSVRGVYSKPPFTEYISTRWYRSPECLLTAGHYDFKMDVWAAGCVFYEILTLQPLFPGSSEIDQINKIHQLMGPPHPKTMSKFYKLVEEDKDKFRGKSQQRRWEAMVNVINEFCQSPNKSKNYEMCIRVKETTGLDKKLPSHISTNARELVKLMLTYEPESRPSTQRVINHPYFNEVRNFKVPDTDVIKSPTVAVYGDEFGRTIVSKYFSYGGANKPMSGEKYTAKPTFLDVLSAAKKSPLLTRNDNNNNVKVQKKIATVKISDGQPLKKETSVLESISAKRPPIPRNETENNLKVLKKSSTIKQAIQANKTVLVEKEEKSFLDSIASKERASWKIETEVNTKLPRNVAAKTKIPLFQTIKTGLPLLESITAKRKLGLKTENDAMGNVSGTVTVKPPIPSLYQPIKKEKEPLSLLESIAAKRQQNMRLEQEEHLKNLNKNFKVQKKSADFLESFKKEPKLLESLATKRTAIGKNEFAFNSKNAAIVSSKPKVNHPYAQFFDKEPSILDSIAAKRPRIMRNDPNNNSFNISSKNFATKPPFQSPYLQSFKKEPSFLDLISAKRHPSTKNGASDELKILNNKAATKTKIPTPFYQYNKEPSFLDSMATKRSPILRNENNNLNILSNTSPKSRSPYFPSFKKEPSYLDSIAAKRVPFNEQTDNSLSSKIILRQVTSEELRKINKTRQLLQLKPIGGTTTKSSSTLATPNKTVSEPKFILPSLNPRLS